MGLRGAAAYLALLLVQNQDQAIVIRISITLIAVMMFAGLLAASLFWLAAAARCAGPDPNPGLGRGRPDSARPGQQRRLPGPGQPGPKRQLSTSAKVAASWPHKTGHSASMPGQGSTASGSRIPRCFYGIEDVGGIVNPLIWPTCSVIGRGSGRAPAACTIC